MSPYGRTSTSSPASMAARSRPSHSRATSAASPRSRGRGRRAARRWPGPRRSRRLGRALRWRRSRSSAGRAVARGDGPSLGSPAPGLRRRGWRRCDRGGLPAASCRTASTSAGSTTQLTVARRTWRPARPGSAAGRRRTSVVVHSSRSSSEPSSAYDSSRAQRDDDRDRLLALALRSGRTAGTCAPDRRPGQLVPSLAAALAQGVHAEPVDARVRRPAEQVDVDGERELLRLARRDLVDGVVVALRRRSVRRRTATRRP